MNSDGYRCQYDDPDWEESDNSGNPYCYLNPGGADAFFFHVTDDRAFSQGHSLHYGSYLGPGRGFTHPVGQLEAVRTSGAINLAWSRVCSLTRSQACLDDLDCPVKESCVDASSELVFAHQISQLDHRDVLFHPLRGYQLAVVGVRLVDGDGEPFGPWKKVSPYMNRYDTQDEDAYPNCSFDPIDDGNTEEDFFDPQSPTRRYGPSTTCYPERVFVHQGDTASFDPATIGDASDGPGLEGETGDGTWVQTRFDLSRFAGRRLLLRFLETGLELSDSQTVEEAFHYNPAPTDDGWFIDDVTLSDTLVEAAVVTPDAKPNTLLGEDLDFDGFAGVCDCDLQDPDVWMLPGPIENLRLSEVEESTVLEWDPTADPGATYVTYDALRSEGPSAFTDESATSCLSSGGDETSATDVEVPGAGETSFYLVRARHACGAGSLGVDSGGSPRTAVPCLSR